MKKGFGIIMAIIFIVIIATIGALSLSLSTKGVKETSDIYLKTQANLLLKSATEYAILAFSAHDRNATNNCINDINMTYPVAGPNRLFDIQIILAYLQNPPGNVACRSFRGNPNATNNPDREQITNPDSNFIMRVDVIVQTAPGVSTEPIRLHRRTIQKP